MKSLKQQKAFKESMENGGNITEAMRVAGYKESTINNPSNLTASKSWEELLEEHLPDSLLADTIEEGLKATKPISARIIMQKGKNDLGSQDAWSKTDDFIEVEDYAVRHKYVETALKIKGKIPELGDKENPLNAAIKVTIQDYGAKDNPTTKATGSPENE